MPYDAKTGKHYDYTEEGIEEYKKETGKGVPMKESPMKNMEYWKNKSGVSTSSSPNKFSTNAGLISAVANMPNPNETIEEKIDRKTEERVEDEVDKAVGGGDAGQNMLI